MVSGNARIAPACSAARAAGVALPGAATMRHSHQDPPRGKATTSATTLTARRTAATSPTTTGLCKESPKLSGTSSTMPRTLGRPSLNNSRVGQCPRCHRWLGEWGTFWRICRCGTGICLDCWAHDCPTCQPASAGPPAAAEQADACGPVERCDVRANRDDTDIVHRQPAISPSVAQDNRIRDMQDHANEHKEARERSRELRDRHEQQGKRPRREVQGRRSASIVTANVTAASTLIEELTYGSALQDDHYLMIQELASSRQDL